MIKVSDLFEVRYGHSLELNRLKITTKEKGFPFVSRKMGDNGVSAYVEKIPGLEPNDAGELTCALSGNGVLSTFIQERPYYTGFHVACLKPLQNLTKAQLLFYCVCIVENRYKYSWGRQANRTLKNIIIPSIADIPDWVNDADPDCFDGADSKKLIKETPELFSNIIRWKSFTFDTLFDLKKGRRLTKANMLPGKTPFIGAIDNNNGLTAFVGQSSLHPANTMTVNYNGSVAEAFYQPLPYRCSDDVNVLYPKFELTPAIALFIATVIRQEKYRFSYGRKWHLDRMKTSTIGLPVDSKGTPDWSFIEHYINTLPYSSQL